MHLYLHFDTLHTLAIVHGSYCYLPAGLLLPRTTFCYTAAFTVDAGSVFALCQVMKHAGSFCCHLRANAGFVLRVCTVSPFRILRSPWLLLPPYAACHCRTRTAVPRASPNKRALPARGSRLVLRSSARRHNIRFTDLRTLFRAYRRHASCWVLFRHAAYRACGFLLRSSPGSFTTDRTVSSDGLRTYLARCAAARARRHATFTWITLHAACRHRTAAHYAALFTRRAALAAAVTLPLRATCVCLFHGSAAVSGSAFCTPAFACAEQPLLPDRYASATHTRIWVHHRSLPACLFCTTFIFPLQWGHFLLPFSPPDSDCLFRLHIHQFCHHHTLPTTVPPCLFIPVHHQILLKSLPSHTCRQPHTTIMHYLPTCWEIATYVSLPLPGLHCWDSVTDYTTIHCILLFTPPFFTTDLAGKGYRHHTTYTPPFPTTGVFPFLYLVLRYTHYTHTTGLPLHTVPHCLPPCLPQPYVHHHGFPKTTTCSLPLLPALLPYLPVCTTRIPATTTTTHACGLCNYLLPAVSSLLTVYICLQDLHICLPTATYHTVAAACPLRTTTCYYHHLACTLHCSATTRTPAAPFTLHTLHSLTHWFPAVAYTHRYLPHTPPHICTATHFITTAHLQEPRTMPALPLLLVGRQTWLDTPAAPAVLPALFIYLQGQEHVHYYHTVNTFCITTYAVHLRAGKQVGVSAGLPSPPTAYYLLPTTFHYLLPTRLPGLYVTVLHLCGSHAAASLYIYTPIRGLPRFMRFTTCALLHAPACSHAVGPLPHLFLPNATCTWSGMVYIPPVLLPIHAPPARYALPPATSCWSRYHHRALRTPPAFTTTFCAPFCCG